MHYDYIKIVICAFFSALCSNCMAPLSTHNNIEYVRNTRATNFQTTLPLTRPFVIYEINDTQINYLTRLRKQDDHVPVFVPSVQESGIVGYSAYDILRAKGHSVDSPPMPAESDILDARSLKNWLSNPSSNEFPAHHCENRTALVPIITVSENTGYTGGKDIYFTGLAAGITTRPQTASVRFKTVFRECPTGIVVWRNEVLVRGLPDTSKTMVKGIQEILFSPLALGEAE